MVQSAPATTVLPRSQVKPEHTWNSPSLFESPAAWEAEFTSLAASLSDLQKFQGRLAEGPNVLADALETYEKLLLRIGKIFVYAGMERAVDTTNQDAAAMDSRATGLFGQLAATASFIDPELLQIGQAALNKWLALEPRLMIYRHYLDNLFRLQQHVRSSEVEEVLGMLADPFFSVSNTSSMLTNADFKFPPAHSATGEELRLVQGTITKLLNNADREVRRTAWENYADQYLAFKNTLASNLAVAIKQDVFNARARRYKSALEASLFQANVPEQVFRNLIETYRKNLPTWHRYWAVRRRALGYSELHPYDIWAPLTNAEPQVPYRQAVDWISAGLAPLGEDYVHALRRGCLEDRWVDIYPNEGKSEGAFSSGWKGTYPFIMMSYTDDLKSMSTLAHELGHSMHSYLTWQNQPLTYSNYSLFVAEVASNFNQAMTRAYLLKQNPDRDFQIALIEEAMNNFHRYFFIMPTLACFELEIHERIERGRGLSADDMINLLADLFSEGYGGEMQVDRQRVGITWAQFGHLYANFYVYQYATGISGAHALSERILSGVPTAAQDYVAFLKAGGSLYPLDALKRAGADLTTPEAVEKTYGVLAGMVGRLEKLFS